MNNRKEKRPLARALGGSELLRATHVTQDSTQIVNTLPLDSIWGPPSVNGHFVPVARYWSQVIGTLSPYCICYDIRDEVVPPCLLAVHISKIPPKWLKDLPVISYIDDDLWADTLTVASLIQLRGLGWLKPMQKIIAMLRKRGHPQAEYWAIFYAEEKLWGALHDDAH